MRHKIAFALFVCIGACLLGAAALSELRSAALLLLALLAILFFVAVYQHACDFFMREVHEQLSETTRENILLVITAFAATLLTHWLSAGLEFGPVVASGLVGVTASLVLPKPLAVAAYTGAFVGMTSPVRFVGWYYVLVAGFLVGVLYVYTRRIYQGFGGRLGTVAALAVWLTVALLQ